MGHLRWLPAAAVLTLLASACGVASATDGPLWTRGFEQSAGHMQAWYNVNDVGRSSTSAHSGDWALDVDGQDFWGIEETWPGQHEVTPGATYEFTGWVKTSQGRGQDVWVSAFFPGADPFLHQVEVVAANGSEWTQYSGTVTAPDGASTVGFRFEGPQAAHIYIDAMSASLVGDEPEPEPTATTPTPSPSETATPDPDPTEEPTEEPTTPPADNVCTDPDIVFEGWEEQGLGEYYASGNIWNDNGNITQTMGVCSHDSWYVDVTAADHEDRAVLSYPNVHRDWHNWSTGEEPRIDSFTEIRSSFAHDAPARGNGIWNVAYDIWINGVGNGSGTTELMIWTENSGQRPAGNQIGTVTVDGRDWELWATSDDLIVSYKAVEPVTSGEMDLQAFMTDLMDRGMLSPDSTLGQIGYGVEIVQTGGQELHFDFTDFTATT